MEQDLRARLLAAPAIAAIVDGRVFWKVRPERSAYPSIVITLVTGQIRQSFDGPTGFQPAQLQFSCFAETEIESFELRKVVIDVILPQAVVGTTEFSRAVDVDYRPRMTNTADGVIHHEVVDATIHHTQLP